MVCRLVALAVLALAGCMVDPPVTHVGELDEVCEGTQPGSACITLLPIASEGVLVALDGASEGVFAWALYEEGRVGPIDENAPRGWRIAGEYPLDLEGDDDARSITIVDFQAGWFEVLGYYRPFPLNPPGEGDALTFPKAAFEAPADAHTRVEVVLDGIR